MEATDKQIHHSEQQHQHCERQQQQQFMTIQKQQMDLIATLLKNQPLAPTAPTLTPIPTTSTATELQALLREIGNDKPSPTLVCDQEWIHYSRIYHIYSPYSPGQD